MEATKSVYDKIKDGYYDPDPKILPILPDGKLKKTNPKKYRDIMLNFFDAKYTAFAEKDKLFRSDLEEEFGLENHPMAEELYKKAWDAGHASGLHEVYNAYSDLVDILKPANSFTLAFTTKINTMRMNGTIHKGVDRVAIANAIRAVALRIEKYDDFYGKIEDDLGNIIGIFEMKN